MCVREYRIHSQSPGSAGTIGHYETPIRRMTAVTAHVRRPLAILLATIVAAGGVAGIGLQHATPAARPNAQPRSHISVPPAPFSRRLLVYGRHPLTTAEVRALTGAAAGPVTPVYGSELQLASGRADYPLVPVQAFTVDPDSYAAAAEQPTLSAALQQGLVLSQTGASLRHVAVGNQLLLADHRRLPVSAIVDDHLLGGYEIATARSVLGQAQSAAASYLLVDAQTSPTALRRSLPGIDLRIESRTRNGFVSSADAVLPQSQIKRLFGEFATTAGTGTLRLDAEWRRAWLASTSLPQLGVITCNKAIIAPLRAAMVEVTRLGLGRLIHTADFQRQGGCYSPRVVRFGGGQLSSHAWGIGIDINIDDNPLGARPVQDPRFVAIMAKQGFIWGGLYLRPDGAHFEWVGARS